MESMPNKRAAYVLLVAVIILWGINWPMMKYALDFIGPLSFAAMRMMMATLIIFTIFLALNRLHLPRRSDWPIILSIGTFHLGLHFLLMNFGLQFIGAGRSAILAYTTPLWVIPLAVLFLGENLRGIRLVGAVIGFSGIVILFNPLTFEWQSNSAIVGNVSLILSAVAWAVSIVLVKKLKWASTPVNLAPWYFLTGSAILVLFALVFESSTPMIWSWELGGILVYNGAIATAFCFIAAITVTHVLSAITTSVGMLGVPMVGVISSSVALNEVIDFSMVLSVILLTYGIYLIATGGRRETVNPAKQF